MPSKQISPYHLRKSLKSSVARSLKAKLGHHSDQGMVWDYVKSQQDALGVSSKTGALADSFDKYEQDLAEAKQVTGWS